MTAAQREAQFALRERAEALGSLAAVRSELAAARGELTPTWERQDMPRYYALMNWLYELRQHEKTLLRKEVHG